MKYKLIIATWLALLPLCLFAQLQQVKASYSNGNQSQNGNISVAGIPSTNGNNIKDTGYSTTIGFLATEETTIENGENTAPIANAGLDQTIIAEGRFTLDGKASFDPNNDELTYLWTSLNGIALEGSTTQNPYFSTDKVKAIQIYQFVLVVNDGELASAPDTVAITITHPDWIPETATNSATFYGLVSFDGENATADDLVAAYINGVNRGVSSIKIIDNQPYVIFNIQAAMEGQANFKLYDVSKDQICEVAETTLIMPGFDMGTPSEPILLNGNCTENSTTCNLTVNNNRICAGTSTMTQFDCTFPIGYTYEWNFDSAIVLSGKDLGPYELKWETAGTKKVAVSSFQNGHLISTTSQSIEVLTVDLTPLTISVCTGETYEFGDSVFTMSTLYIGEFKNQYGCDSLVLLDLMVTDTACQSIEEFSLAGNIFTKDLLPVKEVVVAITEMAGIENRSDVQGNYLLKGLPYHADSSYTLQPTKTDNSLAGISTYDLVLMSKFILGFQKFDSPYQYIAADVNKSGTITAIDIVELRQLMLSMTNEFPNNDAWRFVAADFEFPPIATTNPLSVAFPETITPSEIPADSMGHNFIGVKIGDIDGSNQAISRNNQTSATNFSIHIPHQAIKSDEQTTIQLTGAANQLDGFQFTLQFDPTLLSIIDFKEQLLTKENIGFNQITEGLISFSWIGKATTNQLIELTVIGKENTLTSEVFKIATQSLTPEAYQDNNQIATVDLAFSASKKERSLLLYQNEPNPFSKETIIQFYMPDTKEYQLKILDINGQLLKEINCQGAIGLNEIYLKESSLKGGGIYYYQLISGNQSITKKMILLE